MAAVRQQGGAAGGGGGGGGQQRVAGVESWIMEIPPITRAWVIASVGTSLLVQCQMVAQIQLYFSYKAAFQNGQIWRILTTFTYFGNLSLDLAFHLFFIMRYSRLLEENSFPNNKSDFLMLLSFNATILLAISPLITLPFLASSLAFSLVYIWSRRNPSIRMSLFGLITITAPYLPIALVGFSWVMNGGWHAALGDLLGILAGHTYYVIQDVWPREMSSKGGKGWIVAPGFVRTLLRENRPPVV